MNLSFEIEVWLRKTKIAEKYFDIIFCKEYTEERK